MDDLRRATDVLEPVRRPAGDGTVAFMEVAGLLRQARWEARLSQRALAAQVGISASALSRYEAGRAQPSLRMLDRLLAGCGKQLDATLVHRHADLDADLERRAAKGHAAGLMAIDWRLHAFVIDLSADVVIGGAWAAALHGLPHEPAHGRLWLPGDAASIAAVAGVFARYFPWLYIDGQPVSIVVRPERFTAHPVASWKANGVGHFTTVVVEPGADWPVEVRLDGDLGVLRVVPADLLGSEDGVRPDVYDRWRERRDRISA